MKPPVNLMHWKPGRYVNAASTDLAKTFARVRKEQALIARVEQSGDAAPVIQIRRTK